MKARLLLILVVMTGLAGCTDTPDSIAREYRNALNEGIDAMMFITSETTAERATLRIFKPLKDRISDIDRRLDIVESNRSKEEYIKEVFLSDGVHLYLSEIEVNKQRYMMELTRLRNLVMQYQDRERDLLIAEGIDNPQFDMNEVCPNLLKLVQGDGGLSMLRGQLESPKLKEKIKQFPSWKVKKYDEYYQRFLEKRKTFAPREVKLVY